MALSYVKNLLGTTDNEPPKGFNSWREWWEFKKKEKFNTCSNGSCSKKAILGGHVKKVYGNNNWYIVPLCDGCNKRTDDFFVNESDLQPLNN